MTAYFQAADIVSQVLNFGLPAAIDAQINGNDLEADYDIALRLKDKMRLIPGVSDLRIAEPQDYPTFRVNVDRDKALQLGITQQQVASSMLSTLSGAIAVAAELLARSEIRRQLQRRRAGAAASDRLGRHALEHPAQHSAVEHATAHSARRARPSCSATSRPSLTAGIPPSSRTTPCSASSTSTPPSQGRDLGSVATAVQREINNLGKLPAGTHVVIRGQSQAMRDSFTTLGEGLVLAIILVYLLMVANFQSWLEPFIIMMAVPGALAGVLWMLALTGTTINVESLMGAIMAVGVGVANGNLLITFANELREEGYSPLAAAIEAGRIRFRPIIMTALAMILGMLPMALSLGSGSEQNAPLGRAVIGGLLAATMMTLFVVPAVYSIFSRNLIGKHQRDLEIEAITLPGA